MSVNCNGRADADHQRVQEEEAAEAETGEVRGHWKPDVFSSAADCVCGS